MTDTVTPCLYFDGQAEAAVAFYTSLLPNSTITSVSRYGENGFHPAGTALMVCFTLDGRDFQAINGPHFERTTALSLSIAVDGQAELDRVWSALTRDGGAEGCCGWCTDRYGFSWQVVPRQLGAMVSGDAAAASRTMCAIGGMKKLDIAALAAAHAGDELKLAA